jgi:flagellar motility protein MotE (MotC chaperone)
MTVIILLMGVKVYDFSLGVSAVMAQEHEIKTTHEKSEKQAGQEGTAANTSDAPNPSSVNYTASEIQILHKLSDRRKELDAYAAEMDLREKTLNVLEKKIDTKITSLKNIESQIAELVKTHDKQALKQLNRLVKTYTSMKPKKAAVIFQKLDLANQILLVENMKEKTIAKIFEFIDPKIAEKLTSELLNRRKMPTIEG